MSQHSSLAPSAAYRWFSCPGSVRLCSKVSERPSSAASRLGTSAHAFIEGVLGGRFYPPYQNFVFNYESDEAIHTATVDDEMLEATGVLLEHVQALRSTYPTALLRPEQRVSLEHIRRGMFGTADVVLDVPWDRLIITDYKHGFMPVHIVKPEWILTGTIADMKAINPQLLIYAAGVAHAEGWTHEWIQLEIVQPRCLEVEPIQSITIPAAHLKHWAENDLWEAACNTEMADAPLIAGEHCRFCSALPVCPAMAKEAQRLAAVDFANFEAKPGVLAATILSDEQLRRLLDWAPIIDAWMHDVAAYAFEKLERGEEVPGYKLVNKRTSRQWPEGKTDQEILAAIHDILGESEQLVYRGLSLFSEPKLKSPAQMEKAGVSKEAVAQIAVKPKAGFTMARATDKRSAINPRGEFAVFAERN